MSNIIADFICYWYMRYLLVSELYLVEKWERCMMHGILLIIFFGFLYMNIVLVNLVTNLIV